MSVIQVSHADISGGAARAAYSLNRALNGHGVDSRMMVRHKRSDDWTVEGPDGKLGKAFNLLRPVVGNLAMRLQTSSNSNYHSINCLPSGWAGKLNGSDAKVVHLHWVGGETLSVGDIGRIHKPLLWTLHDMWPFCGAEHYTGDDGPCRWRLGYDKAKRPITHGGLDLDRWVWSRKRRNWTRPMHIVSPSRWLADCARGSALFRDWPVSVIPNVLDTDIFKPLDQAFCRQALALPADRKIILFGAMGGAKDPRKGFDLLLAALKRLGEIENAESTVCVVFGQGTPKNPPLLPFSTRWMGHIHDHAALSLLYNAADVMVVPSRQENLPQTATESLACGCPVVAFDCTGFRDVLAHRETGYLARAFDTADMAEGLRWILDDKDLRQMLGRAARSRALSLWAPEVVVPQYVRAYQSAIEMCG